MGRMGNEEPEVTAGISTSLVKVKINTSSILYRTKYVKMVKKKKKMVKSHFSSVLGC